MSNSMSAGLPAAIATARARWWTLAVVVAAQFIYVADAFIVNVAVPSIRTSLGATAGQIDGAIALYQIAYAGLVVTGGRLGDMLGTKTIFVIGLAGFTLASAWCGLAGSGTELVVARMAQGAVAALMVPQVLSTIHYLFQDQERARAIGIFGTSLGLGAAAGYGIGGWLLAADPAHLGWRAIFLVNLPIGAVLCVAALAVMPARPRGSLRDLDGRGTAVLSAALFLLLTPLLFGGDFGWPAWLLLVAACGVAALVAFWTMEKQAERNGRFPLVPTDMLRDRAFVAGLITVFFFTFANISFYLLMTLYLQTGLGMSALHAGATTLPMAFAFAFVSHGAGLRARRLGSRALIQGCLVQIVGLAAIGGGAMFVEAKHAAVMIAPLVVFGIGQGLTMAPLFGRTLQSVPPRYAGSGVGVLSTVQQIGNASGVAVAAAIWFAFRQDHDPAVSLLLALVPLAGALLITIARLAMPVSGRP